MELTSKHHKKVYLTFSTKKILLKLRKSIVVEFEQASQSFLTHTQVGFEHNWMNNLMA